MSGEGNNLFQGQLSSVVFAAPLWWFSLLCYRFSFVCTNMKDALEGFRLHNDSLGRRGYLASNMTQQLCMVHTFS